MGNVVTRRQTDEEPDLLFKLENENEVEEEPIDFSSLPTELLWLVVEKLDYPDYAHLRQTNKCMLNTCDSKSFLLNCYFPQITITEEEIWVCKKYDYEFDHENVRKPVLWEDLDPTARIETSVAIVQNFLSSEKSVILRDCFAKNRSTIPKVRFNGLVLCEPDELISLLKTVQCRFLDCQQFLRADFFNKDIMSIPNLSMMSCDFSDRQLMLWSGSGLYIKNDSISANGINRLLKQWKSGEREFDTFYLEFDTSAGQRDFEAILDGLDANPIWTPALHYQSAISRLRLEEIGEMMTGDPEHLYSMWRPDDISDVRLIRLNNARVEVTPYSHELDFLYGILSQEQQELVEMCNCVEEDCIHRKFLHKDDSRLALHYGAIMHCLRHWFRYIYNGVLAMWRRFIRV